jgi:hypothetical protein
MILDMEALRLGDEGPTYIQERSATLKLVRDLDRPEHPYVGMTPVATHGLITPACGTPNGEDLYRQLINLGIEEARRINAINTSQSQQTS